MPAHRWEKSPEAGIKRLGEMYFAVQHYLIDFTLIYLDIKFDPASFIFTKNVELNCCLSRLDWHRHKYSIDQTALQVN